MKNRVLLVLSVLALAACGGGGGSNQPDLMFAPGAAAMAKFLSSNQSYTLTGKDSSGASLTLQLGITPNAGTSTFNGVIASSAQASVSISQNGTPAASSLQTDYFNLSPYEAFGDVDSSGSPYQLYSSPGMIPTTINVGDSGAIGSGLYYHDASKATVDANFVDTYTVAADTPETVLLCTVEVISNVTPQGDSDGLAESTESDCFHVGADASITLAHVTLLLGGTTLSFK